MDIFRGKKVLCFIALPHHNRILVPIMESLRERGMEVVYFTAAAEAAFEITLNQAGLPFRHALDYLDRETEEKIAAAFRAIRPIWQEKVLASQILQAVPLPIQDKVICSAIENIHCLDSMIRKERPDLLFALHEINSWGKLLGYLSYLHRIPYITFQEGLCYAATPLYRFHTDYSTACLTWGEADREVLLAAGCSPDKTFAYGNIDLWQAREKAAQRETVAATRAALGLSAEKKVVLFLMSHANYRPFEPTVFLQWLKSHKDVVAVFKWHPITNKDTIERALGDLQKHPSIRSLHDFNTYDLLALSDVCVTVGNSTTGIEGLVFGKPLIEICLPDQVYSFGLHGVAEQAGGFEDVGDKVEEILTRGLSEERRKKVKDYLERHFAFFDGKTVDRVVEMAAEMLRARAEKEPMPLPVAGEAQFPCSIVLAVDGTAPQNMLATLEGIAAHVPADLFEILIVNAAANEKSRELIASLSGDVRVIEGGPGWSFSECCNRAATEARGKHLVFLKPGLIPCQGWLEGLLGAAEEERVGIVGGRVVSENGLLWHIGVAFDVNQSPFSIYRLLPPDFAGARNRREFKAVEAPFLVSRDLFCRLGGFSADLANRFEDLDFCLRVGESGLRVLYAPEGLILRAASSWQPTPEQDQGNRIRFYAKWIGSLWQDDDRYLREDGIDHDALSLLYRDIAARLATGARKALSEMRE